MIINEFADENMDEFGVVLDCRNCEAGVFIAVVDMVGDLNENSPPAFAPKKLPTPPFVFAFASVVVCGCENRLNFGNVEVFVFEKSD